MMTVMILTENGKMIVDLEQFFPASREKVRKLFRLMDRGLDEEEKQKVRLWLARCAAGGKSGSLTAALSEAEKEQERIDRMIADLKRRIRGEKEMTRKAPGRIRDFEVACGGMKDVCEADRHEGSVGAGGKRP